MGTHYRTELLSRETFHAGAGVVRQETGLITTRRSASAEGCRGIVTASSIRILLTPASVWVTTAIHVGMLRREFGSATDRRFFAVFFLIQLLGRRPPDALCRLPSLWWPLTTHRL